MKSTPRQWDGVDSDSETELCVVSVVDTRRDVPDR